MVSDYSELIPARITQVTEHSCSQPTSICRVIGEFPENLPQSREYLLLVFSPSSLPIKKRWRTNGLSADFLADYLAVFFPNGEDNGEVTEQIQSTVSYIANELLENAMKFNDHHSSTSIKIELQLYIDQLVFLVTNSIQPDAVQNYQTFIQEVLTNDPSELLLRRLEQITQDDPLKSSGLGLLTMIDNYLARLGWKFETILGTPEITTVTTMVQVSF